MLLYPEALSSLFEFELTLPYFDEAAATWLETLGLEPSLDHIKWVRHYSSNSTSSTRANEVPCMRVISVPWLYPRLHVLVDTNHSCLKWDVHEYCYWVRSIKARKPFILEKLLDSLSSIQIFAELHPLLQYVGWRHKEVVGNCGSGAYTERI